MKHFRNGIIQLIVLGPIIYIKKKKNKVRKECESLCSVPERGAATAVLQAHVVVGVATEAGLVLHSLVPHTHAAGGASADSLHIHAARPAPHATPVAPLAPQGGTPHRQARVLKE